MTRDQTLALDMLREDGRRELYETAAAGNSKHGSGQFAVTYSNGKGPLLLRRDIDTLLAAGLIRPKNSSAGQYVLSV